MIVDDYGNVAGCRQAVHDFRVGHRITDPIQPIDWAGVYWRRSLDGGASAKQANAFSVPQDVMSVCAIAPK